MSATITIGLTPQAEAILARIKTLPSDVILALVKVMDQQNQFTIAHIQAEYLSFSKSQPPTLAGLRVITNRLRGSIRASKTAIVMGGIQSAIGSNVEYAAIHEFGGTITRTTKPGSVRLRENASGELMRQPGRGGAVFAAAHHKRARSVAFPGGKTYTVTLPARAPVQKGIADRLENYRDAISAVIEKLNPGGNS